MKVEEGALQPAEAPANELDRWLAAPERRDRSRGEPTEAAGGESRRFMVPPRPVWPRVFPGL